MPSSSLATLVAPPADGCLPVQPPLTLERVDAAHWDAHCDVLIVGLGAAGAAAAITAREAGADVLIAERFDGGGASAKSGGVVYAGGGTPHQKKHGYNDTPDAMFRYLRLETGDAVGDATLRKFCEDSRGLLAWLETLGANFESSEKPPKTSYPKDGVYLYYSGNEGVPEYAQHAPPAPRGHRTRGSWLSGKALYEFLRKRVDALQIPVWTQAAVHRLVTDHSGAVIGAELRRLPAAAAARHRKLTARAEAFHNFAQGYSDKLRAQALAIEMSEGKIQRVRAQRGVVLSTGGFIFNRAMVAELAPRFKQTMRLGATGCDGSGIRMGQSAGGAAARLDKVSAWRFINPPSFWPRGIVVNQQGRRFCNEQVYGAKLGVEMCESNDGKAWLILDKPLRKAAMKEALTGGLWPFQSVPAFMLMLFAKRAKSIEALARKIGAPEEALRWTLDNYNVAGRTNAKDPLGKDASMRQVMDTPPYYAMNISADSKTFPCPAITLGGLRVDEASGAVLRADGQPVRGLYAAGRAAVGIASNHYISGLSLADCLWSGRRAGRAAAPGND